MAAYYDTSVVSIFGGKNQTNSQNRTQIEVARGIAKSLGMYTAARYLAKREWTIEAALFVLLGK